MNHQNRIKKTMGDKVFLILSNTLLILIFICILYPLLFVLSASISDPDAVNVGKMVLWPISPRLDGYKYVLQFADVWIGYGNTIIYTVFGTILALSTTIPCAYALSRRDMEGRNILMIIFMITMYFSGGLIPTYIVVKSLGLLNNRLFMVLSGMISVYNLIVAKTFFGNTIPWELHEASFIDGCSDFQAFYKVALPLSKPILIVLLLYYGVGHWNSYFEAMIYLNDRDKYPLQIFLREILLQSNWASSVIQQGVTFSESEMQDLLKQISTSNMLKYVLIVISSLPMLIVYPFLQRFFEKGVMIGAIKG